MKKHTGKWEGVMIHHSAGSQSDTVDKIRDIHINQRGWGDIGYHYVIEIKDNKAYIKTGRSDKYAGAHASVDKYNNSFIGICVVGNYSKYAMNEELYQSVLGAIVHICRKYKTDLIKGHRDVKATECPGGYFPLEKLKQDVRKLC